MSLYYYWGHTEYILSTTTEYILNSQCQEGAIYVILNLTNLVFELLNLGYVLTFKVLHDDMTVTDTSLLLCLIHSRKSGAIGATNIFAVWICFESKNV